MRGRDFTAIGPKVSKPPIVGHQDNDVGWGFGVGGMGEHPYSDKPQGNESRGAAKKRFAHDNCFWRKMAVAFRASRPSGRKRANTGKAWGGLSHSNSSARPPCEVIFS